MPLWENNFCDLYLYIHKLCIIYTKLISVPLFPKALDRPVKICYTEWKLKNKRRWKETVRGRFITEKGRSVQAPNGSPPNPSLSRGAERAFYYALTGSPVTEKWARSNPNLGGNTDNRGSSPLFALSLWLGAFYFFWKDNKNEVGKISRRSV